MSDAIPMKLGSDGVIVPMTDVEVAQRAVDAAVQVVTNFVGIDPRQFYQALAMDGKITQAECLAYLKSGTIPSSIQTVVNNLPAGQQFPTLCLLIGALTYQRTNPLVPVIGAAMGLSSADLDALWTLAATL